MFQLTKLWIDQEPGIEMVEIRYTWSPLGEPAQWSGEEEEEVLVVVPNTSPRVRQAVIEIPRYLNGRDSYQLHHSFVFVKDGQEQFSPVFSEEIVAQEVPYVDREGRITEVRRLWDAGITVKGMAHITGGGLMDNPPRIFPKSVAARIQRGSWPVPPIFQLIQRVGRISEAEMAHVFNLGLGILLIVPADQADRVLGILGEGAWIVGEVIPRGDGPAVRIE